MLTSRRSKLALFAVWALLLAYAFTLAPPDDPRMTAALLRGAFTGRFAGVDPAVAAVFSALGVVPLLVAALLIPDGRGQRASVWPFVLGMFAAGAFALVPYLLLRREVPPDPTRWPRATRAARSRVLGWALVAALAALLGWALAAGSAAAYLRAFRTARVVHVMTLDLALCAALLPRLVREARRRERVADEPGWALLVLAVPLLGPAVWNAVVRRSDR